MVATEVSFQTLLDDPIQLRVGTEAQQLRHVVLACRIRLRVGIRVCYTVYAQRRWASAIRMSRAVSPMSTAVPCLSTRPASCSPRAILS